MSTTYEAEHTETVTGVATVFFRDPISDPDTDFLTADVAVDVAALLESNTFVSRTPLLLGLRLDPPFSLMAALAWAANVRLGILVLVTDCRLILGNRLLTAGSVRRIQKTVQERLMVKIYSN